LAQKWYKNFLNLLGVTVYHGAAVAHGC